MALFLDITIRLVFIWIRIEENILKSKLIEVAHI